MRKPSAGLVAAVSTAGLIASVALMGSGVLDGASADVNRAAAPAAGDTYTFFDPDRTPNAQDVSYQLPSLPAGAYSVSLMAGLEPKGQTPDENLYCQVSDTTKVYRILVVTAHWRDSAATFVSGSSAVRLAADNDLRVACSAEHGKFTYAGDPLRVTFVRLGSWTSTVISPE
jgi:hypothetical protein